MIIKILKKLFSYIRLFWYFATNWNPMLAAFIIFHDVKGERKYHIDTTSPEELNTLSTGNNDISGSSRYEAVNYFVLEDLLRKMRILSNDNSFTDLGCGKGRAMVVAAHFGFTRIHGVDFAKEVCLEAENHMQTTSQYITDLDYQIECMNVLDYEIKSSESIFFLFNPFDEATLREILRKVEQSQKMYPRIIYFIYASPRYIETFFEFGYDPVYRLKKMKYLEGVILKKSIRFKS